MKISYNAPVVLTFVLLSLGELILGYVTHGASKVYFVSSSWVGGLLYVLGHVNLNHYVNNMIFILLLGPMLEEKYGSLVLLTMITATALLTAVTSFFLSGAVLIGASGITFMMIMLSSMMSIKSGAISLTFILLVILYAGREFIALIIPDGTSHFAHLFGGLMGGILGNIFAPRLRN